MAVPLYLLRDLRRENLAIEGAKLMAAKLSDLTFTGERVVPGNVEPSLWAEHISRYAFAANFVAGKRVLDFACGAGYGSALLRSAGARWVVGNDIAVDAIRYARDHFSDSRTHFAAADCLRLSFHDDAFDVLVSFETIEHVPSYEVFLVEARRVLSPDGLLIISTPNKRTYSDESVKEDNPYHVHEFYLEEFQQALSVHFPTIKLYSQNVAEGPFFAEIGAPGPEQTVELLKLGGGVAPRALQAAEASDFFLALCTAEASTSDGLEAHPHYFHWAQTNELHHLRQKISQLQAEFDRRMSWALEVDRKLADRGRQLLDLQAEYDERTLWALRLNTELAEANAAKAELQAAIDASNARAQTLVARTTELEDRVFELQSKVAVSDELIRSLQDQSNLESS